MEIILLWLVFAVLVAILAASRGQNAAIAFVVALILSPVVGFILVLASPDKRAEARHRELVAAVKSQGGVDDTRPCPRCAETIKRAAVACRFCQAEVEPLPAPAPDLMPLPTAPGKEGVSPLGVVLLILLFLVAVVGGVMQLGSNADKTFERVSEEMR